MTAGAAEPGRGALVVEARSRDGDKPLGQGKLTVIDNEINQSTATVRLKAIFANPRQALWPNQFVRARLRLATRHNAIVVPAAVVQRGPQGTFAYVVGLDAKAAVRPVGVDSIEGSWPSSRAAFRPASRWWWRGSSDPGAGSPQGRAERFVHGVVAAKRGDGMSRGVSEPFIRRPVATTLLVAGLLLVGLLAFGQLPVSALPQVDYPTIVVSTYLPGGSAETMGTAVTTPLERQFGQMPSLAQMTSVSSFSYSQITLQFDLERSIDAAQQDVQAAINAASSLLPRQLPTPPTYSKSNPAD